jgi:hypothetical protein
MSNISFSSGYGEYVSGEFLGGVAFELRSNNFPIFSREFRSNSPNFVNLTDDTFTFTNHNFITGEELIYDYKLDTSNTPIRISPTVISGITTNILPETLYAIKIDFSTIQVAATKEDALLETPIYLNLTNYGTGPHKISSKNPNKNTLITINNVIQDPIVSTAITTFTVESIDESDLSVLVDDPTILKGGDLIKIDNEFLRVLSVGIGSENNVFLERPVLGSESELHASNSTIIKVKGNYNIVDNFIYFTASPYGNIFDLESGLENGSTFSGRVFFRSGIKNDDIGPYDKNFIFDDISPEFTGVKEFFTLKENFSDVTGISTDNAIITINDVFQPPSRLTGNIINGAYVLTENSGISSITFTGNTVFPKYDVNISEFPRGGVLFSVGSTEGFGYQPLISAGGTAIVSTAGTIQSISIGYSGSGYRAGIQTVNVGVGYSDVIDFDIEIIGTASVSDGKIISVNITNPGTGYTQTNPPEVYFDFPLSYSNIPLIYSSESSGIGTEATIDIVVGQGSSVIDFDLSKLGYSYKNGDILTVQVGGQSGIPTDTSLPFEEFKIFVDDIYEDDSSIRTIGQLIVFDPIDALFDGQRKSFPLRLNGQQTAVLAKIGSDINVRNSMLIFIDTVLQVPEEAYNFEGGSIITLNDAPRSGSTSTILFYAGTEGVDTKLVDVLETVKPGDTLKIFDNFVRFKDQNPRTVNEITSVDVTRTNLYDKQGISINDEVRPVKWCPQNVDKFIAGSGSTVTNVVAKDRVIYEPLIYPTAFAIAGVGTTSDQIFVDNVKTFFDNANESPVVNDIIIVSQKVQVGALLSATVSVAGTIQSIEILNSGLGYNSTPQVSISPPIGVGTTARASATINSNGSISSINITNSGTGYTNTSDVYVIVEEPRQIIEFAEDVSYEGDFGFIVGVGTTSISTIDALTFELYIPQDSFLRDTSINNVGSAITGPSDISNGYYFYVNNTNIGNSIISLNTANQTIGVGTTFFDNVYQVHSSKIKQKNISGIGITFVNEVTVKVQDNSSFVGISQTAFYGEYSWGRIYNVSKSGIATFAAYSPGITTSTIIQRRNPLKYLNYLV